MPSAPIGAQSTVCPPNTRVHELNTVECKPPYTRSANLLAYFGSTLAGAGRGPLHHLMWAARPAAFLVTISPQLGQGRRP